jgi:hypothetical protein
MIYAASSPHLGSSSTITFRFSRAATPTLRERWDNKSPFDSSLWICRLTHSPFSHVDLLLDDGNLLGASDNPLAPVIRGNARGVAIRPPEYQRFAVRRDVTIKTTAERKASFIEFCMDQLGKPFDGEALSPKVFLSPHFEYRDWRATDRWFCAELMAHGCEVAPLVDWEIPGIKNRVTPADLILLLAPLYDFGVARKPIEGLKLEPWEQ